MTPPMASDPHSADCGPRTTSIRDARSALRISNRGVSPDAGSLILIPSTNSKVWLASAPRMRTSVSEPAGPDVATAADGVSRSRAADQRLAEALDPLLVDDGDAGRAFAPPLPGAREAVMTIWSVSMGSDGHVNPPVDELVVTEGCAADGGAGPRSTAGPGRGNGRRTKAGS